MSFLHPLIYLKNCALAGLAGIVTGTVIHSIRKYPETGKKILIVSCLSGSAGLGVGYTFGVIRKKNVYVYSLATGLNFLIVPLVFFGVRQVVQDGDAIAVFVPKEKAMEFVVKDPYALSVSSGSITGLLTSLYSMKRSLKSTVLSMMVGSVVAGSGQFTYNVLNKWRIHKAMQIHYPELFEKKKMKFCVVMWYLGNGSWFSVLHRVMDARGKLGEHEKIEVTWEEWMDDLVSRKRKLGRLEDKLLRLEMEFELLEKEEGELIQEQT